MIRRPPRSTLFPTRRSSDLSASVFASVDVTRHRLGPDPQKVGQQAPRERDRKSTRLNSSHSQISYAVFCLKKKKKTTMTRYLRLPSSLFPDMRQLRCVACPA